MPSTARAASEAAAGLRPRRRFSFVLVNFSVAICGGSPRGIFNDVMTAL
jgi:hypothetical protein